MTNQDTHVRKSTVHLTWAIVLCMIAGLLAGIVLGPKAAPLGVVGKLFIQLIKVMAVPLVFLTITEALVTTSLSWRSAKPFFLVILINGACALTLGLLLSNILRPGSHEALPALSQSHGEEVQLKEFSLSSVVSSMVPQSIVHPFLENNVFCVVLLSLAVGVALRKQACLQGGSTLEFVSRGLSFVTAVWSMILRWLVRLVPIAVFCVSARTVGEYGFAPFRGLGWYVGVALLGLVLQAVLVYPLWIRFARLDVGAFYAAARRALVYAFGTNSSLATLPVTLEVLDELQVSKESSRLGACVGTNLNNDGIVLYEVMAVLFVAQAYGVQLTLGEQLTAAAMSLVAAVGVAGVPEAGVISLSLVLSAVGMPLEIVPLLLTVDWLVARMRSVVNVLSDMTVSIALDALSGARRAKPA